MILENELFALRQNILADTSINPVSISQLGGLNGLMRQGLRDKSREMRIAVLKTWIEEPMKRIAGVEVQSSKNMTASAASFIINLLRVPDSTPWRLSKYGQELIELTETKIKSKTIPEQGEAR